MKNYSERILQIILKRKNYKLKNFYIFHLNRDSVKVV